MSHSLSRVQGFTLIEVLVALALMSLIGTILIESLRVGGHTWQHVSHQAANVDEISRAQQFLRQRLQAVYPPRPALGITALPSSFVGESSTLEFSSAAADQTGAAVRYWLGLSGSGSADVEIRYQQERARSARSDTADGSSEPLLTQATGLSIQYWEDSAGSVGHWVDRWESGTKLPRLIRIDVHFSDTDPRRWPPLYVEPRIDTRASCVFDVVSRRCRTEV